MRISISVLCGLLISVTILTAQAPPVTTLSNAELFSRQYAQADTGIEAKANQGFSVQNQNLIPRKRRIKKSSIFKTTLGSAVCGAGGFLVGSAIAASIINQFEKDEGEWRGLGVAIAGISIGGPTGVVTGSSMGTYFIGKKYRRGSYWHALAGAILPALAVAGTTVLVSDESHFNPGPTFVALSLAPITSTAAYYIFSEDTTDCK